LSPINSISADLGIDIAALKGVTQDSRLVEKDYLFAAFKGDVVDGRDYIPDALKRGASIILSDQSITLDDERIIKTQNPREKFAHITAEFYAHKQPETLMAVTGTNGKSSVVHFTQQLWDALGKKSESIGTLSGAMTTPDPVALHEILARMDDDGVTHVAMEASSHGLNQNRMDGVGVSVAAFTSFSQDHLDYHADMDAYLAAKARLFSDLLDENGTAVLNADIPEYKILADICTKRGVKVLSYGKQGEGVQIQSLNVEGLSQRVALNILGYDYNVTMPLVGAFQVMNALCALSCVLAETPDDAQKLVSALETLEPVTGRLQNVASDDGRYNAYIDYAHTPDALENVLNALREHTKGRLICVFGCGGDRDAAKRPMMGEVASRLSDVAMITNDNPRSESPDSIRAEILGGMQRASSEIHNIGGRAEAIQCAINIMEPNDLVLIAGKGHEQGQIFKNETLPFDDVAHAKCALDVIASSKTTT